MVHSTEKKTNKPVTFGWRVGVGIAVVSSGVGAVITIGLYEWLLSDATYWAPSESVVQKESVLLTLAVVGLYVVAILIAVITLWFMVSGSKWVEDLAESLVESKLRETERSIQVRLQGRTAFVAWQISRFNDIEPIEFLHEAIDLTRRSYLGRIDNAGDAAVQLANNLACFLAERGHELDRDEALRLSDIVLESYEENGGVDEWVFSYAEVLWTYCNEPEDIRLRRQRVLPHLKVLARSTQNDATRRRAHSWIARLEDPGSN